MVTLMLKMVLFVEPIDTKVTYMSVQHLQPVLLLMVPTQLSELLMCGVNWHRINKGIY